jgi:hypothetical protein
MKGRQVMLAGSVLVAAMILGISGIAPADPGEKCTDATLDGFYVFTASGFSIVGGVPQPVAIVEQIRFNGDGTVDVPGGRISVNGAVFPTVATGAYTIASLTPPNKGCEGILTFPRDDVHLYMFIPPHANEIQLIRTDTGTVFQGTATKVSK